MKSCIEKKKYERKDWQYIQIFLNIKNNFSPVNLFV